MKISSVSRWAALLILALCATRCYSSEIVFVRSARGPLADEQQSQIAADFYGVDFKVMTAAGDDAALKQAIRDQNTIGVVIAADALQELKRDSIFPLLKRSGSNSVPLLVVGLKPETDPALVQEWSNGTVLGCKPFDGGSPGHYVFSSASNLTHQLSGIELSEPVESALFEVERETKAAQTIISIQNDGHTGPVFTAVTVGQTKAFFACSDSVHEGAPNGPDVVETFVRSAPEMIFTRYAAGDFGWHALQHYANFTVDDPWLRQPYGSVDYLGLLGEMEKHNFHTTIAFIPWNFDRSEPAVVSMFRSHPDRFSIAIHGDNHDHKEFTDYKSKPYEVQLFDLKQSLARMAKFRQLTGVPYDNVMIFPHSIAPERTLHALKVYNYLATVNSANVPQGDTAPASASFALRPVTLAFGNFPSVSRLEVGGPVPTDFIAVNEFLDNPLFFYTHAEFFAQGIGAFDAVADKVNQLEPSIRWARLGDILPHLYQVRRRVDNDYDVLAFSSNLCVDNMSDHDAVFHVRKPETDEQLIRDVSSSDRSIPYQVQSDLLSFSMSIPAGGSRCAAISYRNDLNLSSIDIGKHSPIVYFLRKASDFRDIYLAKLSLGLKIINYYNAHQLKPAQVLVPMFLIMLAIACGLFRLILGWRRRMPLPGRSS
jgi:hypothetical protein